MAQPRAGRRRMNDSPGLVGEDQRLHVKVRGEDVAFILAHMFEFVNT